MQAIKAIPTRYKGYHFRSRLEARWAVFFDALGLSWEYEPEGFILPDGTRYLPDFRVTNTKGVASWYEVKPKDAPTDEKFEAFSKAKRRYSTEEDGCQSHFQQLSGDPLDFLDFRIGDFCTKNPSGCRACPNCGSICEPIWITCCNGFVDGFYCAGCADRMYYLGVEKATASAIVPCKFWDDVVDISPNAQRLYARKITAAAHAARSARFEYGQSGAS